MYGMFYDDMHNLWDSFNSSEDSCHGLLGYDTMWLFGRV